MPFAIGIENVKSEVNVGSLLRSAYNLGAALVFTVGRRYTPQYTDTTKAWRHLPVLHFLDWEEYRAHAPFGWIPIAVEIVYGAVPIESFVHPKAAVYILGPEDGSVSKSVLGWTKAQIEIPSKYCLNVATAGAIVMYDRVAKRQRDATRLRPV